MKKKSLWIHQVFTTAEIFQINPVIAALNGGKDYELLFIVPLSYYEQIKDHQQLSLIGTYDYQRRRGVIGKPNR
ncbi:MAG: hypothetical protein ACMUEM_07465 [Flavobacteriales bacterium AspAUS03]